jgi:flagellar hook-associated protein 3 FlgL
MTSYISTHSITSSLRQSVLQLQSELASNEVEMATGHYADTGVALGAKTAEAVSLQNEQDLLQSITSSNQIVVMRLNTTQDILANLQSSAQSLLNSLVQGNGSTTNANTIQAAGESNLKALIASLNTSVNGDYIFGGTNTAIQPVTDYYASGSANKSAVDAAFLAAFGAPQDSPAVSAISGGSMQDFLNTQFAALFQGTSWHANWSSASDQTLISHISGDQTASTSVSANNPAFHELAQAYTMIADLGTQNLNSSAYGAVVSTARGLLTSAISNLTNVQANVGITQSAISSATNQISMQMNILSTQAGNLENVNTYEIATRVTNLQTQIETAYSLTSQLQHLSLVAYL